MAKLHSGSTIQMLYGRRMSHPRKQQKAGAEVNSSVEWRNPSQFTRYLVVLYRSWLRSEFNFHPIFSFQQSSWRVAIKCREGPMGLAIPNLAERHTQQQKASEQKHGSDKSVSSFAGDVFFNLREIEKSFERNGEKERDPGHFSSTILLLSFCCCSVRARAHREESIVCDGCSSIIVVLAIIGIGFCPLLQFMVCDVADEGITRWPFHCFVFHKGRRIGSPPSCQVHCTCKKSFHKNTPNVTAPAWLDETEPIHSILSTVHYDS